MQSFAKWILRSISTADAINWLKQVKETAPEFVFNNLLDTAQEELSELQFAIVLEGIEEEIAA